MAKSISTRSPHGSTVTQFPGNAITVTPDDVTEYPDGISLYVGVGGDVVVTPAQEGDAEVTFTGFPDGSVLPLRVKQVKATGTTASGFVGIY